MQKKNKQTNKQNIVENCTNNGRAETLGEIARVHLRERAVVGHVLQMKHKERERLPVLLRQLVQDAAQLRLKRNPTFQTIQQHMQFMYSNALIKF